MRDFKKETISVRGGQKLIRLLQRAEDLLRLYASASGVIGVPEHRKQKKDLIEAAQAIDAWLEEWTKDDHPHAICARALADGAHTVF